MARPPQTKILLHFGEPAGVLPSDAMGNLEDMNLIAGETTMPGVGEAWTGRGRVFSAASGTGISALDREGRDTLLQRDATVQAILAITPNGLDQHLIAGGLLTGEEAENPDFGIVFNDAGANIEARWYHATPGFPGTIVYAPPGVWRHLGDGKFFLFTATRRWESSSRVVVRYYVGPDQVAELEWSEGNIGGGTTGHTLVGVSPGMDGHFNGVIDELLVANYEMSPEEIRHAHRKLTEYLPQGVAMYVGLSPPGLPWYANPANNFGRRVKVIGQALGTGVAAAEELRALWLPDAAPLAHIPGWEFLCGLTARPRDSLDARRARVVSYMRREQGLHHAAVKAAYEGPLGVSSDDIQIIEGENEIRDSFTAIAAERWDAEPTAEWTIVANQLRLSVASGQSLAAAPMHARYLRMSLERGDNGRVFLGVKVAAVSAADLPASSGVGLLLYSRVSGDFLWLGVYNDAGTLKLAWQKRVAGVASAVTMLAVAPAAPLWLRLYTPMAHGTALGASGQFTAAWSSTGPSAGFTTSSLGSTGVTDSLWAGIAAVGGTLGANLQADFDDWISYCPDGDRTACWYVYADPAVADEADMFGARLLARRYRPAHTHSAAIRSLSVLCGHPEYGLPLNGPCGGF